MKNLFSKINFLGILFFLSAVTSAQVITTFAGTGTSGYSGDGGLANLAMCGIVEGITFDAAGNAYISDPGNNRIRKVNTSGIISTFAGNGTPGNTGDGGLAVNAQISSPNGLVVDALGNLFFSDQASNVVRKISVSGIISTIAGIGTNGYAGDGGPATLAKFDNPTAIALDALGNIYISDYLNNRIRKINTSGIITTVAGNGVPIYGGDGGPATAAQLNGPYAMCLDAIGNMYIATFNDNRIRKVNTSGIISTIAGTGASSSTGDGGPATSASINGPAALLADPAGNLFIGDYSGSKIRKINTSGIISTVAGNGSGGYSGDGGLATSAQILTPDALSMSPAGDLYINEELNYIIRKVNLATSIHESVSMNLTETLSPNPFKDKIYINLQLAENVSVTNALGQVIYSEKMESGKNEINLQDQPLGIYFVKFGNESKKVVKQ